MFPISQMSSLHGVFLSSSDINKLSRQSSIFKRMARSLLNAAESILIECYLSPGLYTEQPEGQWLTRLWWVSIKKTKLCQDLRILELLTRFDRTCLKAITFFTLMCNRWEDILLRPLTCSHLLTRKVVWLAFLSWVLLLQCVLFFLCIPSTVFMLKICHPRHDSPSKEVRNNKIQQSCCNLLLFISTTENGSFLFRFGVWLTISLRI